MLRALVVVLVIGVLSSPRVFAQGTEGEAGAPAPPPATEPPAADAPATPPVIETPVEAAPVAEPPVAEPNKFPNGWRLMLSDLTILRLNPTGLETRARFGVQKKLFPSDKKITENNFFFAGVFPKLNPASAQIGLGGEIQPASIFNLRVFYELQKFFGTFGYLQSFPTANTNYSDAQLAENKDNPTPATEVQATTTKHLGIAPMLQLKFGKIAVRSLWQLDYWDVDVRSGDAVAYEPTFDTLLPDKGWTIATDTDVLYVPGTGLAAGLRYTWVKPLYKTEHFTDAADEGAYDGQNAHHRLGFFGAYTLKDKGPSTFNKPTVIVILSFYLKHKYRAGEPGTLDPGHDADDYRTRAFPYFIAGFAFESDLLAVQP